MFIELKKITKYLTQVNTHIYIHNLKPLFFLKQGSKKTKLRKLIRVEEDKDEIGKEHINGFKSLVMLQFQSEVVDSQASHCNSVLCNLCIWGTHSKSTDILKYNKEILKYDHKCECAFTIKIQRNFYCGVLNYCV